MQEKAVVDGFEEEVGIRKTRVLKRDRPELRTESKKVRHAS
jgi:hypothetical protein